MATTKPGRHYQPVDPIEFPPIYAWPPKPVATLRWLWTGVLFPWGLIFIGLAVVSAHWLTPAKTTLATLELGWVLALWLRNAVLLGLLAGGLHWWLYFKRAQDKTLKFNDRWLARDSKTFLFRDQLKDNVFYSIVSGCTIWTAWEAVTLWLMASGRVASTTWSESPLYLGAMVLFAFFWSTFHFYFVHRWLHWPRVYRIAHELHHRNTNTGPWTGISMHPIEHVVYFSLFALWWIVPVDPVVVILTGFFNGLSPAVSHSGFERITLGVKKSIVAGGYFHHLHHRLFDTNYGNTITPLDRAFDSWHDGTDAADRRFAMRRRRLKDVTS